MITAPTTDHYRMLRLRKQDSSHRVHVRRGEPFADAPRGNGWRLEEETEEDEWNPCTADRIGRYGRAHRASRKRQREMLASLMLSWLSSGWHPYAPPSAGERSEAFTENSDPLSGECLHRLPRPAARRQADGAGMVQNGDLETRLRFMRTGAEPAKCLQSFWQVVEPALPSILDGFYQHVTAEPHLKDMIGDNIPHLKQAQAAHWGRLFVGRLDTAYCDSVYTIGTIHHKMGLEPRWYIGGYNFVLNRLTDLAIGAFRWSPAKLRGVLDGVIARVMLDMDISISVYQEALLVERQQRGLRVDALLRDFEQTAGSLVGTVASAATQLRNTAQSLAATTEQTTVQSASVAAAVEQASVNVQTVASAAEELS